MTARVDALVASIALATVLVACGGDGDNRTPTGPAALGQGGTTGPRSTGPIAFVSTRDGSPYIYVANADGSAATRLAPGEAPAWSRDGRIAFHRSGQIFVMDGTGSSVRAVGSGFNPDWSPDGTRLVFGTVDGSGGISVMNVDGSGRRLLIASTFVQAGDGVLSPAWSPDGRSIAFVRANWEEPRQIYVMNADGSEPRRLINGSIPAQSEPSWSPDGTTLAFESPFGLATVAADGSDWSGSGWNFLNMPISRVFDPDWTPDAGSLVFNTFTSTSGDATSQFGSRMRIFIVPVGGGSPRQLIPDAASPAAANYWDHQPVWSRVGR